MALVGDGALLEFDGEVAGQGALPLVVGGRLEHARGHRRVGGHEVGAVRVEVLRVLGEQFGLDGLGVVCHGSFPLFDSYVVTLYAACTAAQPGFHLCAIAEYAMTGNDDSFAGVSWYRGYAKRP